MSNNQKAKMTYIPGYGYVKEEYLREVDHDAGYYTDEYFSRSWKDGESEVCTHEWVNVSFNFINEACKHCGTDKPKEKT